MIPRRAMEHLNSCLGFMEGRGYTYIELPWAVEPRFTHFTKPPGRADFPLGAHGDTLVASGEQSFLKLAKEQKLNGRFIGLTPCFRDEPTLDAWHLPYFLKAELFVPVYGDHYNTGMTEVAMDALDFHRMWLPGSDLTLEFTQDECDLVFKSSVELGSYGVRRFEGLRYIFGTACAEPRFSKCHEWAFTPMRK